MSNRRGSGRGLAGQPRDHWFTGLCLIVMGSVALLEQRGHEVMVWLWAHWPLALAAVGALRVATARDAEQLGGGMFILIVSGWLYACQTRYGGMTYANSWPVLLVGMGVWNVLLGGLNMVWKRPGVKHNEEQQSS